jgi:hypothetical protein
LQRLVSGRFAINEILPILAQSLAPDNVWFALLLLVVLALLHSLSSLRDRPAEQRHAQHRLHGIGHRLHELLTHRHH